MRKIWTIEVLRILKKIKLEERERELEFEGERERVSNGREKEERKRKRKRKKEKEKKKKKKMIFYTFRPEINQNLYKCPSKLFLFAPKILVII